ITNKIQIFEQGHGPTIEISIRFNFALTGRIAWHTKLAIEVKKWGDGIDPLPLAHGRVDMRNRAISILLASTALMAIAPAYAQDASEPEAADGASDGIVVTGTRIVRDGYTAPTPVTVATTEELVKTTPSSLPDALNKLPQFQNSLSPSRAASNFSNIPIQGN